MANAAQTARRLLQTPPVRPPQPVRRPGAARTAQAAAPVSRPSDPAEREAAAVAQRALARPLPAPRAAPAAPRVAPPSVSVPGTAGSSGQPLPRAARREMEARLDADFSQVRVHTGDPAARASRRLNAAAFTAGRDIFFARGRYQPQQPAGRELLAHELVHTVQQRAAPQAAPQRSVDTTVRERVPATTVHRLGVQDALDYFAEQAAWLPGFTMLSYLLGFNPVNLRSVTRNAGNLLRALIQLIPGGPLITQALDNHGIVDRVAAWAEGQLSALGDIGASIRDAIDRFLDELSWSDIFDLGGVWERAKRIVTEPIDRIVAFGSGLVDGIVTFIKDAILRPIAGLVEPTRGWPLLCAVLGFNPITGDAVARTPAAMIGGFMTLIGQDEVWQNIQRGNAIGQAWTWFQTALAELLGFASEIPGLFVAAFRSLELVDIILVPRAFMKVATVFGGFASRFVSWGLGTVIRLLEIVFSVVAPGAMDYLRRAGAAIQGIFRNPMGFVGNLVRAATTGFRRFAGNFLNHLMAGLLQWLTGALPGVYIPQALNLLEIAKFVLSVLGVTWDNIRAKLVRHVGEPAVRAMEMGFELLVTLVRDGPVAAWEQLREQLANLRQMAIDSIRDMIVGFVVERAVPRLVAMFIPGAGFIAAIVSIYGTITTMVSQLQRIVQVVTAFLDSMMAIASGNITAAATRVEQVLARGIPLVISFVAGFLGLGNVAARVRALIERIRAPIDRAMDRVVAWIVAQARRLGRFIAQAGVPNDPNERLRLGVQAAMGVIARRPPGSRLSAALVATLVGAIRVRYGLRVLEAVERGGRWWLRAVINPEIERILPEEDIDLLNQIYPIADAEYRAAEARGQPMGARGTHDAPRVLPPGSLADSAVALGPRPAPGHIDVLDTAPGSSTPMRAVVRSPGFSGGDALITGATETERRVDIGRYSAVAAELGRIGNDRLAAEAAMGVIIGGDLPSRPVDLRPMAGWFGGFRALMAMEVRRDPIALATLSSAMSLAAAGAVSIREVFERVGHDAAARRTPGGLFPHSATPASAPNRGARVMLNQPLPADAPASRGTVADRTRTLRSTVEVITRAAQQLLRTRNRPGNAEIVAAVRQVMSTLL